MATSIIPEGGREGEREGREGGREGGRVGERKKGRARRIEGRQYVHVAVLCVCIHTQSVTVYARINTKYSKLYTHTHALSLLYLPAVHS